MTGPESLRPETLFAEETLWQSWLDVEAALARVQGRIGIIPAEAAASISAAATLDRIGADNLRASIAGTRAPVMSLSRLLAEAVGEDGRWVHWGATTQNVIQTGRLLLIRRALAAIRGHLAQATERLADLAETHAETPMAGRTNRRHALPITFGFKVAGWIEELGRADARLGDATDRCLRLPFGGAVGAHHGFGADADRLMDGLAAELNLGRMLVPGRAVNDLFVEVVVQLSMFGMSVERIAREIYTLMSEEIGELSEMHAPGVVGSSTMPHKVNPKRVVRVQAQCARLRAQAAPAMESGLSSHEGDAAANHLLAAVLDDAVPLAWTLAEGLVDLLDRTRVDTDRMRANLDHSGPYLATERLMMVLGRETGRGRAHDLIHHAVETAQRNCGDLIETVMKEPEIAALGADRVRDLLDPKNYVGASVDIARAAARLVRRSGNSAP